MTGCTTCCELPGAGLHVPAACVPMADVVPGLAGPVFIGVTTLDGSADAAGPKLLPPGVGAKVGVPKW